MLVSIITPTYSRGDFLEQTILSIKNQGYKNIEHIIIDGSSTDNTLEILKKYENTYNMKWLSEKDRGIHHAMNKGFKMATGDIFCWLDADDLYLSGTIQKIVEVFEKNPTIDVVFGNILIIDENNTQINYMKHVNFDIDTILYWGQNINPQTSFWRKHVHYKIGEFNEKYKAALDYDFFIRMAMTGAKFFHIKEFLSMYRVHSSQNTQVLKSILEQESKEISDKYTKASKIKKYYKKIKIILSRLFRYTIQGDLFYVLRSILNKLRIIHLKP